MSFDAMAWASKQKCGSAGEKLVLLMLADRTNGDTGRCDPSHSRLAKDCEMGVSTLKRHIASLATKGFLRIEHRSAEGVQLPNHYHLAMPVESGQSGDGGSGSGRGVGPNRAGGGSESGYKPGTEPGSITSGIPPIVPPQDFDANPSSITEDEPPPSSALEPDCIPSDLWRDFLDHRKAIKKPMTDRAVAMMARKLAAFAERGINVVDVVETSIRSGWSDIYEPRTERKANGNDYASRITNWYAFDF